jgi:hypothetical protein
LSSDGSKEMRLVKLDLNGNINYSYDYFAYNNLTEQASALITNANDLILVANTTSSSSNYTSPFIVSVREDGSENWQKEIDLGVSAFIYGICVNSDGTYSAVGKIADGSKYLALYLNLDDSGNVLNQTTFATNDENRFVSVSQRSDGGYTVFAEMYIANNKTMGIYRLNSDGEID